MSRNSAMEEQRRLASEIAASERIMSILRDHELAWQSMWKIEELLGCTMNRDPNLHVRLEAIREIIKSSKSAY